jgi:gamma-glutamyltranspeptidase/glutathione hydrolase
MANRFSFTVLVTMLLVSTGTTRAIAQPAERVPVVAHEQMVVAANPYAVEAGIAILRAGGSAVDAAIAVQTVLSMVEPQSSGIGGGAFMLHFEAPERTSGKPRLTAYEGREAAPAAATEELFLDANGRPLPFPRIAWGGLSVGVPGVMRMLETAHREHGRLPWSELFAPAIALAEQGFEISPRLYFLLDRFADAAAARSFKAHYYDADGHALEPGTRLVNLPYANTLRAIAAQGADVMYTGALAQEIVATVNGNALNPGLLSLADLAAYTPHKSEPLCSPYREWTVCGPQLPSSGGIAVQQILAMAQSFELSRDEPVAAIHVLAEASRLAFADRNLYLADPAFVSVPVESLLSPDYLRERAKLIDPAHAQTVVEPGRPGRLAAWDYAPSPFTDLASTSHFSIVDRWGDAVSMTTSVQSTFGSQLMVGGFMLNNQLTDFATQPRSAGQPVANRPEGGKRPLSSMSPSFVLDGEGRLHLLIGSPGGTRIIGFVTQAIVGVLDFGLDIQAAVAAPHFLAQSATLEIEEDSELLALSGALEALGHDVQPRSLNSGLHGIVIEYGDDGRTLYGGVDPRREGLALGD